MKAIISVFFGLICFPAICQTAASETSKRARVPAWAYERMERLIAEYRVSDRLDPDVLVGDLCGDKREDVAFFVESVPGGRKGIVIVENGTDRYFVAGAGVEFAAAGDDFSWAEEWTLHTQSSTYETTFDENNEVEGSRAVSLNRSAISIRETEGSGGLVYFNGEKLVWIHQGD